MTADLGAHRAGVGQSGRSGESRPLVLGRESEGPDVAWRLPKWPPDDRTEVVTGRSVALVGTYPPTACGLATFTSNLRAAIAANGWGWDASVVRVLEQWELERSDDVVASWVVGDGASLHHALHALNSFDAVLLQHEYGLFGGRDGEDVLGLVGGLEVPLLAVLHTAPLEPMPHQREILDRILDAAAVVVVQSEAARQRIVAVHDADPDDVIVIPHGAAANFFGPDRSRLVPRRRSALAARSRHPRGIP